MHRLDARVKVILLAAYSVALFAAGAWTGLGLAVLLLGAVLAASGLPWGRVLAMAAPVYVIAAFAVAFNALSGGLGAPTAGESALASALAALSPTAGLGRGLFFGLRIVLLAWGSLLVSYTSTSTELTDALRGFLAPLRPLRVPVDDAATALALAVRFIPLTAEELGRFTAFMAGAGALDRLEERLIDAGSAVSGCGPAFVCQFIEALADGGVACGLPRQKALLYAAQTLRGTARLMLDTGAHPGAMKDAVCSPAGSTIAGVQVLERRALRGAVMDAVAAAAQKNAALGQS